MKKSFINIIFLLMFFMKVTPVTASPIDPALHLVFSSKLKSFAQNLTIDPQMLLATELAISNAYQRSKNRCWRAVKNALLQANVILDRPSTRHAKQAGKELEEKFGFKKLDISDPLEAPPNSILVYGGKGSGHVEIRTHYGFVSDFFNTQPSPRPLLGVYVRTAVF